jgi:hypothetical protein
VSGNSLLLNVSIAVALAVALLIDRAKHPANFFRDGCETVASGGIRQAKEASIVHRIRTAQQKFDGAVGPCFALLTVKVLAPLLQRIQQLWSSKLSLRPRAAGPALTPLLIV